MNVPASLFPHASESLHWYYPDGKPAYEVPSSDGTKMVNPDIRHARKLSLLPSVTTVMRVLAAPGLERWKREQFALSALTLTRSPNEPDEHFLRRVDEDSRAWALKRADEGTRLHKAIEQAFRGEDYDRAFADHVELVKKKLDQLPLAFVADFKTKDTLDGKLERALFYDEHVMQLAAYAKALDHVDRADLTFEQCVVGEGYAGRCDVHRRGCSVAPLVSIMIGVRPAAVAVKIWEPAEAERGWSMFEHALKLWQLKNRYAPKAMP
ncbi:MAG: hypothetical protein EPN38_09395 [Rhodanobacteraceae bacterium]|nr:MAG: hypothetical protein EPN38_09395 [Rhodanobacteraceae bacterium]